MEPFKRGRSASTEQGGDNKRLCRDLTDGPGDIDAVFNCGLLNYQQFAAEEEYLRGTAIPDHLNQDFYPGGDGAYALPGISALGDIPMLDYDSMDLALSLPEWSNYDYDNGNSVLDSTHQISWNQSTVELENDITELGSVNVGPFEQTPPSLVEGPTISPSPISRRIATPSSVSEVPGSRYSTMTANSDTLRPLPAHETFGTESSTSDKMPKMVNERNEDVVMEDCVEHGAEGAQFDTCFGEVMVRVISSFDWKGDVQPMPVTIEPFGNVLKLLLCTQPQNQKYVGMITMPALRKLHEKHPVHLVGTLFPPKPTDAGPDADPDRDPMVHVLVYGNRDDKDSIAACLNEGGALLQHPITARFDPRITYLNPNYLVRPGGKGPQLGEIVALGEAQEPQPQTARPISSPEKNRIMQIFDSAVPETAICSAVKQSQRLSTTLKEYQLAALSVMVERETSRVHDYRFPSLWGRVNDSSGYRNNITGVTQDQPTPLKGGILADEMGLGKTLSLLALVCFSMDNLNERNIPDSHPRATLVVAPKSTIPAWEHQIKTHIRPGQVRYLVYHGTKRTGAQQPLNRHYDIVITTYETLHHDSKADHKLRDEKWYRVVLDEAHRIRNRASAQFKAAAELNSHYRWCLTGTPIQNSLDDYGALLAFLQVETFGEKRLFDYWIAGPMQRKGAAGVSVCVSNLKLLVAATCLRRTKNMVEDAVDLHLPDKKEVIEPIQLAAAEREIYGFFQRRASKLIIELGQPEQIPLAGAPCERKDNNNTLSIINNMRLICNHGEDLLPKSQLAIWHDHKKAQEAKSSRPEREEGPSLQSPGGIHYNSTTGSNKSSTKVQALLKNLEKEQTVVSPKPVKSVVFSQWTKMLDRVGDALRAFNYEFARIDGGSSLEYRSAALQSFNQNDDCTVMLASIRSAAEGIDMTAAAFVHILEPHWNPKLEEQAIGRVHRIGQTRNVRVTRYLVENSIEDYVRWLQDDKNWITQISLTGPDVELSSLDLDCQRREKLQQVFTLAE